MSGGSIDTFDLSGAEQQGGRRWGLAHLDLIITLETYLVKVSLTFDRKRFPIVIAKIAVKTVIIITFISGILIIGRHFVKKRYI